MRKSSRSFFVGLLIAGSTISLSGNALLADTIYFLSGRDKKILKTPNVMITKIAKDQGIESIFYTSDSGSSRSKPLEMVVQIEVEGEAVFNQAEAEFAKGDLKGAGQDYRKALNSSKEWIKHRADVRLLGISSQTGDFLGAVDGFVQLAKKEPSSAGHHKPAVASAQPAQLETAVGAVNKGLGGASTETQLVLLPFLVELYNKQGNASKAQATLDIMSKFALRGDTTTGNSTVNAAAQDAQLAAKQAQAEVALTNAGKALTGQQYDKAIQEITSHSTAFSTPDLQARALFLIADAKAAQATTADALEDAALAYMRVVAFCKSQPSVPDALYKTAVIEERLKKILEAKTLYTQIVNEYAGTKAATDAQAAITRINSGK